MAAAAQIPLVPGASISRPEDPWAGVMWLACELTVEIAVPNFTVGDLLKLAPGDVVDSLWNNASEVPLTINEHRIADTNFEAIGQRLAVRISELA
jgi:flagellar motor switch/type III secretory pathway protein FliN